MYRNLRIVYITTKDKEEARSIGRTLVEEKLAACVNIIDKMESIYHWEGELVEDSECILMAKTHISKVNQVSERVMELHSYDMPCVICFNLAENEGNESYLNWLLDEIR